MDKQETIKPKHSIRKLLNGQTETIVTFDKGEGGCCLKTATERHIGPNLAAIILTLVAHDPDSWKKRPNINLKVNLK